MYGTIRSSFFYSELDGSIHCVHVLETHQQSHGVFPTHQHSGYSELDGSIRCVDVLETHQQSHEEFFQHMNTMDISIQFTVEEARPDGWIPFLDILVTPQSDVTFTTKICRKPTHSDLYLQWDSHHKLAAK